MDLVSLFVSEHSVSIRDGVFSWDEDGTPTLNK